MRELTDTEVHELAVQCYRGEQIVVDDDPAWGRALMLISPPITEAYNSGNLGGILVPTQPHLRGLWDGHIPVVVTECRLLTKPSWTRLCDEWARIKGAVDQPAADVPLKRRWEAHKPTRRSSR